MSTLPLGETSFVSLSCYCIKLTKETKKAKKLKKKKNAANDIKVAIKA